MQKNNSLIESLLFFFKSKVRKKFLKLRIMAEIDDDNSLAMDASKARARHQR